MIGLYEFWKKLKKYIYTHSYNENDNEMWIQPRFLPRTCQTSIVLLRFPAVHYARDRMPGGSILH